MADNGFVTIYDVRGKPTSMRINLAEVSSANIDTVQANVALLAGALLAISNSGHAVRGVTTNDTTGGSANDGGLRGTKAIIRWYSADENEGEGAYGSNEIGSIDETAFTSIGGKLLLQGTAYANLKSAFDAVALTENGNSVAVYEVECISRNLS